MVFLLLVLTGINGRKGVIVSAFATVLFYMMFGPAALFMALLLLLFRFSVPRHERYLFGYALVFVASIVVASLSLRFGWVGAPRFAYLPDFYFEPRLAPSSLLYLPYWFFIGSLCCVYFLSGYFARTKKVIRIAGVLLVLGTGGSYLLKKELPEVLKDHRFKELDYYLMQEDWPSIVKNCSNTVKNHLYMNYLNLALLQQNRLAEDLFNFDQRGTQSLWVPWNKASHVSTLLGEVAFASGQISLAQRMIFEGAVGRPSSISGRHLKRLVQTNLIHGAHAVAEKYLDLLDQTLFYDDWAGYYRRFVGEDEAIASHPILGNLRLAVPVSQGLLMDEPLLEELDETLKKRPSNRRVLEYQGAYLLLKKDLENFKRFIEAYYGTPVLPELPRSFQEGVIAYSESDPEYWKQYGVTPGCASRYQAYKKMLQGQPRTRAAATAMQRSFGNTFWFFYMFK